VVKFETELITPWLANKELECNEKVFLIHPSFILLLVMVSPPPNFSPSSRAKGKTSTNYTSSI
jgi:hypothetical protein